jgi:hypothetical protein
MLSHSYSEDSHSESNDGGMILTQLKEEDQKIETEISK